MKRFARFGLVVAAAVSVVTGTSLLAADKPAGAAKYSIEEAMKKLNKPKGNNIYTHVVSGKGTAEEKKMVVEYYESLALSKPEKGDLKEWQKMTAAMLAAAKAVEAKGDAASLAALKSTSNCKACHDIFQ
ncbi:hypothetical protein [Humisphaera borealis]|uniref:Cytochrome C n=1 Tax=Humisphaera borealis TaxID=2807512 RepID=A0A7M2WTG1_9BACT|nr:hypothetical protein [Humisphaera borealis]QOV88101.1 hypothetical protein IPV69_17785 [Humisphaera borealis]